MIIFNGTASREVGVIVEKYPARPIPKRKFEKFDVPGRSGAIYAPEDAWENVSQKYEIYVSAEIMGLPIVAAAAARWLSVPGYCRLEDEYDREVFRRAAFVGPVDLENTLNQFGRATIEFDCDPRRFLKAGEAAMPIARGDVLRNPTGFTAAPIVSVTGTGVCALRFGGVSAPTLLELEIPANAALPVTLDAEEQEIFDANGVARPSWVSTGRFEFLRLPAGDTEMEFSSETITALALTPRWWTI